MIEILNHMYLKRNQTPQNQMKHMNRNVRRNLPLNRRNSLL